MKEELLHCNPEGQLCRPEERPEVVSLHHFLTVKLKTEQENDENSAQACLRRKRSEAERFVLD
jgi:hypothetical protein